MRTESGVWLSDPQERLMRELAKAGGFHVSAGALRTARTLADRGFVTMRGRDRVQLTPRGREIAGEL